MTNRNRQKEGRIRHLVDHEKATLWKSTHLDSLKFFAMPAKSNNYGSNPVSFKT